MTSEKRELIELLLADRCFIYSLLHKLIGRAPDDEMLDLFLTEQTAQAFSILSDEEGDVLGKTPLFLDELKNDRANDSKFLDKLKSEYTRLFVGPLTLVAPPWESVYYNDDAMLFQASTLKVREFYRSFGLLPEGYPHVADDSLALELAFMTELSNRAMSAFTAGDDAELKKLLDGSARFLREHLLVWIPRFLKKLADAETDYLYPQVCLILDSFIKKDSEMTGLILTELT